MLLFKEKSLQTELGPYQVHILQSNVATVILDHVLFHLTTMAVHRNYLRLLMELRTGWDRKLNG